MKKRFFLLLLAMLLLCQPVTVLADTATDDEDEFNSNDVANDDDDETENASIVQIKTNTKLSSATDSAEYRTAIACTLRSTDDNYYSTIVNGIPSALSWWEYHASNGVQYMGDQLKKDKMTTLLKSLTYYAKTDKFWTITVNGVTYEPGDDVDWRKISIGEVPNSAQKRFQEWYTNCYIKSILKSADTQDLFSRVAPGGEDSSLVKDWPSSISAAKSLQWKPSYSGTCEIISPTSTRSNYWNYVYAVYYNMLEDYEKFLKTVDKNNANRDDTSGFLTSKFLKDYWDPDSFKLKDGATTQGFDSVAFHLPNTVVATHIYVLYNNTSSKSGDSNWHPTHRYADKNMNGTNAYLYLYLRAGVARNSTECAYLNTTYSTKRLTEKTKVDGYKKKLRWYYYNFATPSIIAEDNTVDGELHYSLENGYSSNYRQYVSSSPTIVDGKTVGFDSSNLKLSPGDDIALMLYTVKDTASAYAEQIQGIRPIDMYSHAKTWKKLVTENDSVKMSNYYTLFTGKTQYLLGNTAPSHYTFDHVSYTNGNDAPGIVSKGSNNKTKIDASVTSLKDFYKMLPVDTQRNASSSQVVAYGWCGKLTNTHGDYGNNSGAYKANIEGLTDSDYNYTSSGTSYSKFSSDFKKNSIVYKILFPSNSSTVNATNDMDYDTKSAYDAYFNTDTSYAVAMRNRNIIFSVLTSGDSSPVVGQKVLYLTVGTGKDDVNLTAFNGKTPSKKTKKLYIGKYDDLYERSYHSQMWKSIGMQAGQKHQDIMNKYGDDSINYGKNDYVLWTDKLDSSNPSKVSNGAQAPLTYNLYHWITATKDEYNSNTKTTPFLGDGNNYTETTKASNYLYYMYDWYRSQPMTEITAWYRPYQYKVIYHRYLGNSGYDDRKVIQSADTSLTLNGSKSDSLVFYDNYDVLDIKDVDGRDKDQIRSDTGYTFLGWTTQPGSKKVEYSAVPGNGQNTFNAIDPTNHPAFYIDRAGAGDGSEVHLYGVWEKNRYYVRYYANRPNETNLTDQYWPTTFNDNSNNMAERALSYVNTDINMTNPVISVEEIQEYMNKTNGAFYKPGWYIAGWTIGNSSGDACGGNYYNGKGYFESSTRATHNAMLTQWANTTDSKSTFYLQPYRTEKDGNTAGGKINTLYQSESLKRDRELFGSNIKYRYVFGNLYESILKGNAYIPALKPSGDNDGYDAESPSVPYYCNDPTDGVNDALAIDGEFYHIGVTSNNSKAVWTDMVKYYQTEKYLEDISYEITDQLRDQRWPFCNVNSLKQMRVEEHDVHLDVWLDESQEALSWLSASLPDGVHRSETRAAISAVRTAACDLLPYARGVSMYEVEDFADKMLALSSLLEELDFLLNSYYGEYNSFRDLSSLIDGYEPYQNREEMSRINKELPFATYNFFFSHEAKRFIDGVGSTIKEAKIQCYNTKVIPTYYEAFTVYPVVTFYAHWEPERFYVRYNANDATANKVNVQSTDPTKQLPYNPATAKFTYNNRVTESQKGNSANKQAFIWEEVHYDDPKVAYKDVSGWWMRENEKDVSNFKGLTDIVEYTGANAYKANKDRSDASSQNTLETGRTLEYTGIRKRLGIVEGFDSNHFDYIYDLYAMFDDWPILRMGKESNYVGDSITYAQASSMTAGFTGTNLDGHTGTALEDYLLSTKMVNNASLLRLVEVSYDREDCARNGYSSPISNNTWANPFGNSSTMFNTFDKTLDPTNTPVPKTQGNTARVAIPTNGSTGATKYYIRFLDPKYILSSADSDSVDPVQTKYELRYYIKDSDGKSYEQNGVFYVGSSLEEIMTNSGGGN